MGSVEFRDGMDDDRAEDRAEREDQQVAGADQRSDERGEEDEQDDAAQEALIGLVGRHAGAVARRVLGGLRLGVAGGFGHARNFTILTGRTRRSGGRDVDRVGRARRRVDGSIGGWWQIGGV